MRDPLCLRLVGQVPLGPYANTCASPPQLAHTPTLAQTAHTAYLPPAVERSAGPLWWSTSAAVTLSPPPASGLLTALDNQGRLHLLWHTCYAPQFIYHTYLTAQGWAPPAPIAPTLGRSELLYPPLVDQEDALVGDVAHKPALDLRRRRSLDVGVPVTALPGRHGVDCFCLLVEVQDGQHRAAHLAAAPAHMGDLRKTLAQEPAQAQPIEQQRQLEAGDQERRSLSIRRAGLGRRQRPC